MQPDTARGSVYGQDGRIQPKPELDGQAGAAAMTSVDFVLRSAASGDGAGVHGWEDPSTRRVPAAGRNGVGRGQIADIGCWTGRLPDVTHRSVPGSGASASLRDRWHQSSGQPAIRFEGSIGPRLANSRSQTHRRSWSSAGNRSPWGRTCCVEVRAHRTRRCSWEGAALS